MFLRKDRAKPKNSKIQIRLICVDSTWIGTNEKSMVKQPHTSTTSVVIGISSLWPFVKVEGIGKFFLIL
jgi:hypothetical protein